MADFTADADTLDSQGNLHTQIARFYRDLASEVRTQGSKILSEFQRVQNTSYAGNYASQYQHWLKGSWQDDLEQEAQLHDMWARYFHDLAQQVRQAESALSSNNPPSQHGGLHFE